ncbi:hypothetical protein BDW02DRAFT_603023 [Decorospora gaudefroyi]|uniref:Uncharacterized protein n=1 Tax=Decorospora gaudefroyi TaxID=184978 RepID=A0A6A5JZ47_9PLEO|nr:hypothetical protein BDW02DRAFT_603023 [Decorospora gaudefroyi]
MAGYGNQTAPDYLAENMTAQHTDTRLDLMHSNTPYHNPHDKHGSGTTGGAGYGNKRSSSTPTDTDTSSTSTSTNPTPFPSHATTAPYTNASRLGSGSTGGAGYGNKTGEMEGPSTDSRVGRWVEKVGGLVGKERIVDVGRGMREGKGLGSG